MKNSRSYNSIDIFENTRIANLIVLQPDLSTEVHLELEWFQIILSVYLSVLQVMKFWKGVKVGN